MTLQIWFWLLMALWVLFGFWRERGNPTPNWPLWAGGTAIQFFLFLMIGWKVFGSPVN